MSACAFSAPGFDPVQGASRKCAPLAANAAPISLLTAGEMVLQSAMIASLAHAFDQAVRSEGDCREPWRYRRRSRKCSRRSRRLPRASRRRCLCPPSPVPALCRRCATTARLRGPPSVDAGPWDTHDAESEKTKLCHRILILSKAMILAIAVRSVKLSSGEQPQDQQVRWLERV